MDFNSSDPVRRLGLDSDVDTQDVEDGDFDLKTGHDKLPAAERAWPPPFSWRRSSRARRISLHVTAEKGLEIVTAKNISEKTALAFLEEKRSWVEKHAAIIYRAAAPLQLPTEITLTALDRTWFVSYQAVVGARFVRCKFDGDYFLVRGAIDNHELVLKSVRRSLQRQAHEVLRSWLDRLSEACMLPYRNLSIRAQKNIWGSCSHQDDISLNYKLLFLSPPVVEYVLIHELCHTKVRNHSARFWKKVAIHCPRYALSKKQLRLDAEKIPSWVSRQI